jgi:hypothetical protein
VCSVGGHVEVIEIVVQVDLLHAREPTIPAVCVAGVGSKGAERESTHAILTLTPNP